MLPAQTFISSKRISVMKCVDKSSNVMIIIYEYRLFWVHDQFAYLNLVKCKRAAPMLFRFLIEIYNVLILKGWNEMINHEILNKSCKCYTEYASIIIFKFIPELYLIKSLLYVFCAILLVNWWLICEKNPRFFFKQQVYLYISFWLY